MKYGFRKVTSFIKMSLNSGRSRGLAGVCPWLLLVMIALPAWCQSGWHTEVVDGGDGKGDVGYSPSLAIDVQGNLHIAYYDQSHDSLSYAYRGKDDKIWSKMIVERHTGSFLSLAVDSKGFPHISCVGKWEDGLHYDYWDGQTWHKQIIDPGKVDYYNSIQLDANDNPRISYYLYHSPEGHYILHLKYAFFDGRQWFIQTVDRSQGTGKWNSMALDHDGNPHIAYSAVGRGDLLYAAWNGSQWSYGDADSRRLTGTYVGVGNSIDLDSAGNPHIASFDITRKTVRYTYWDGKKWDAEIVDQLGDKNEGDHVSLKMDAGGHPHLAYYDALTGVLKYAVRDAAGWHIQIADHNGNVGLNPSLYLDRQGTPFIAYYDATNGVLKLAYQGPPTAATLVRR